MKCLLLIFPRSSCYYTTYKSCARAKNTFL